MPEVSSYLKDSELKKKLLRVTAICSLRPSSTQNSMHAHYLYSPPVTSSPADQGIYFLFAKYKSLLSSLHDHVTGPQLESIQSTPQNDKLHCNPSIHVFLFQVVFCNLTQQVDISLKTTTFHSV